MDSVEKVNSINIEMTDDKIVNFPREKAKAKSKKAQPPISSSHMEEIPKNAEFKHWWRLQTDIGIMSWLCDNVEPKLVGRSIKLMIAAQRQTPPGTLPDDDATLAQCAGYGHGLTMWLTVKDRVLSDIWFKRSDGRWQCAALTEGIVSAHKAKKNFSRAGRPKKADVKAVPTQVIDSQSDDEIPF